MYDSNIWPISQVLLKDKLRFIYFLLLEFSNVKNQLI